MLNEIETNFTQSNPGMEHRHHQVIPLWLSRNKDYWEDNKIFIMSLNISGTLNLLFLLSRYRLVQPGKRFLLLMHLNKVDVIIRITCTRKIINKTRHIHDNDIFPRFFSLECRDAFMRRFTAILMSLQHYSRPNASAA